MTIDLRSDTVTRPSEDMLQCMLHAKLGDDVFGEDPTVNELEERLAHEFDMEAGLFCPSGTMTNQIAIKVHTSPGEEVICEKMAHIYQYEGGGIAFHSGCQVRPLEGERGQINASQVEPLINPDDVHKARTRLVCLENTANRGGGSCYSLEEIARIRALCTNHRLALHLDGARLYNALVAKGEHPSDYGPLFDSISICLSKGLGTPAGSVLLGSSDFIKEARRWRKVFGGGMRQAGILAAAGLYALDHHIERLAMDHAHARSIGQELQRQAWVRSVLPVETNIVIFELHPFLSTTHLLQNLRQQGILALAISRTQIRMVLHLDITQDMVLRVCEAVRSIDQTAALQQN